jgi:hypothetical protein
MDRDSSSADSSITPSTASLNQKLATSPGPRMLTASEIALLKQSAKEIAARIEAQGSGDE